MQKDKRKAYFKFLIPRDSCSKTAYNRIQDHFERVIKFKKSTFYKSQLTKTQTNIRAVWKILNSLIIKCIPQHSPLVRDPLTNDIIKEPFEIAEAFNNFFISIPKKNCVILIISRLSIKAIKLTKHNLLQSELIHFS